jgi:hypothetical protein
LGFFTREIGRVIQLEGCPLCRLCDESLGRGWFWLFSESYGEGSVVSKYIDYWGFCKEHSRMIARIGPKWQKSVIYQWIIKAHLSQLEEFQRRVQHLERPRTIISRMASRRSAAKTVRSIIPTGDCLFCETLRETARRWISYLLESLVDPQIRRLYADSDGLCMQHFFLAIEDANLRHAPEVNELIKKQTKGLRELMDDFNEFFRKEDYRFSNEPKGNEQNAWMRAMTKFIGGMKSGETDEIVKR